MNSELVLALCWFGSTNVRKLASKNMLQFHWYLRVGSDPCHFANFANDVSQNVPRTTKTELDAGFHSTRSRERKRAQTSSKMLPKSSPRGPKSLPRAPKELPRSSTELPRCSKERPRSPQISQQSPSSSQGLSKGRPKGLQGTLWEAFWDDLGLKTEVSEPMLTHFLS